MTHAVVVGSGPNGLAAAVTLAAAGVTVRVLEAATVPGGGVRSSELTLPGLLHDECSAFHPLACDTPFSRRIDLARYGLHWLTPDLSYSHPLDGGRGSAAWRSLERTVEGLEGDGRRWRTVFGGVTRRLPRITEDILVPAVHVPHHPLDLVRFGAAAGLPAHVLSKVWRGESARALFAGVAAHAFRPFGTLASSAIGFTLGAAAHRYGWPVARGGSQAIAHAMIAALTDMGGTVETGITVSSLDMLSDADVVLLDVAPAAAASIAGSRLPDRVARTLRKYRHGPGAFKVDYAVDGGIPWQHEDSRSAGTVHVGGSLKDIADAEAQVARGRMPLRPFVLVGQQSVVDPSRSLGGVQPVYSYAHVPAGYTGDATAAIEAQIERFAPGFRDRILMRHIRSTPAMAMHNVNYVGGDIVTGANDTRQLLLRPRPALDPYSLGAPGLYLCSAATPPGAGAHGMCGYNAATSALKYLNR